MQDSQSSEAPSATPRQRPQLVLIVEQDTWLRSALTGLFEEIGFTVVTASNGYGGLRQAINLSPGIVVIGSALPELSSAQLADELRTLRGGRDMQLIRTTDLQGDLPPRSPQTFVGGQRPRALLDHEPHAYVHHADFRPVMYGAVTRNLRGATCAATFAHETCRVHALHPTPQVREQLT